MWNQMLMTCAFRGYKQHNQHSVTSKQKNPQFRKDMLPIAMWMSQAFCEWMKPGTKNWNIEQSEIP